jgi:hypothetical protein
MDLVRRYERKNVDLVADAPDRAPAEEPDPALVEAAIAAFVVLPPVQRSAVVLEDVLGHSLEQTATTMGTTVAAVKAALARARANLATSRSPVASVAADEVADLLLPARLHATCLLRARGVGGRPRRADSRFPLRAPHRRRHALHSRVIEGACTRLGSRDHVWRFVLATRRGVRQLW